MSSREQRIEEIAYRLWELEGRPEGQSDRHWHAAVKAFEAEIASAAAKISAEAGKEPPKKQAPAKPKVEKVEPAATLAPSKTKTDAAKAKTEAAPSAVKKTNSEPARKPGPAKR